MTTCTEARRLLEELATTGRCDQCGNRIENSVNHGIYCACRHHRPCRHRTWKDCPVCAFLAQPEPAAREAMRVKVIVQRESP